MLHHFKMQEVYGDPEPFLLCSPSDHDKVLSVDSYGRLTYQYPEDADDAVWTLQIPVNNTPFRNEQVGNHMVSFKYRYALQYDSESGEAVSAIPFKSSGDTTVWYNTYDGEIYTIDVKHDGERKYLWNIMDGLYVTPDEHLAEQWKVTSPQGQTLSLPSDPANFRYLQWAPLVVLVIVIILLLLAKLYWGWTPSKRKR